MKLLWKLLRKHVNVWQLGGFFLTNLVGVGIVLLAVQLYSDVKPLLSAPDSFLANDYLVLSKEVKSGERNSAFTDDELDDLRTQPFTVDMGAFSSARYEITGSLSMGGYGMSTYLFLESVPDKFLDITPTDWKFQPGDRRVPIILPRNYLNLYNFGFASTQGLPQMSEAAVQAFPLTLDIAGNRQRAQFQGRVVAFSNRLNTILVPESFIAWSNEKFSNRPATNPSRVIIETRNTGDEALLAYLRTHHYRVEGEEDAGQAGYFLRLATAGVAGVGLLITAMSIFVLMLSVLLLLQKNTRKLQDLLLLGYTPTQVARPYQLLTLTLNFSVLLCSVALVLWARSFYSPYMLLLGEAPASGISAMILTGLAIAALITGVNALLIRHNIRRLL